MNRFRAIVVCASLVVALTPLAAFADNSTSHDQAEVANAVAQLAQAQQQVSDMQTQAQDSAANARMIALLKSEALRQMQLNNVANGNALERIAAALANAARADGDLNAQNELLIAQTKAASLIAIADANVANGLMLAQTKGRWDELANAQAQSQLLHEAADMISGTLVEAKMASAKQVGQDRADAIHTPAIAEQQNSEAMGANDVLAADSVLAAGQLDATSVAISSDAVENEMLAHAEASLNNAEVMLADATEP